MYFKSDILVYWDICTIGIYNILLTAIFIEPRTILYTEWSLKGNSLGEKKKAMKRKQLKVEWEHIGKRKGVHESETGTRWKREKCVNPYIHVQKGYNETFQSLIN